MILRTQTVLATASLLISTGLLAACGDDSSDGTTEAGVDSGASQDDPTGPVTPTDTDDTEETDDTATEPTDTETDESTDEATETDDTTECTDPVEVVCDGNARVEEDPCTGESTTLETCEVACELGECVECQQLSGRVCSDGDVHRFDSCGNVGDLLETCANGCANGNCISEECEPRASFTCGGSAETGEFVLAVDSCGNPGGVERVCEMGCENGACIGCVDEGDTVCFDGDVYAIDSCDSVGARVEDCAGTCAFTSGAQSAAECIEDTGECLMTDDTVCLLGDMHPLDSCGNALADIVEDCSNGCNSDGCLPCVQLPTGTQCVEGNVHAVLTGCDMPGEVAEAPSEVCAFGCQEGVCLPEPSCEGAECDGGAPGPVDSGLPDSGVTPGDSSVDPEPQPEAGADAGVSDAG